MSGVANQGAKRQRRVNKRPYVPAQGYVRGRGYDPYERVGIPKPYRNYGRTAKDTFKRYEKAPGGFGKKRPGVPSPSRRYGPWVAVPAWWTAVQFAEYGWELYEWYRSQRPGAYHGDWTWCAGPCAPVAQSANGPQKRFGYAGNNCLGCLQGQGDPGTSNGWYWPSVGERPYWESPFSGNAAYTLIFSRWRPNTLNDYVYVFRKPATVGAREPAVFARPVYPMVAPNPAPDPNWQRDPRSSPNPATWPEPHDYSPPDRTLPRDRSSDGRPNRPHRREPPRRRDREVKGKSGPQLWRFLDMISEGAELVDAVYDALPKSVRKKWNEKPGCGKGRGLIDTAGQYGIDGADCKLQAIYYNADKIDLWEAVRNALLNELSDKIVGNIMRKLPRNIGQADGGGMKSLNELLALLGDGDYAGIAEMFRFGD